MEYSNKELNNAILNKLKMDIFRMIRENHKTKIHNDTTLNNKLRKTIERVVDDDN
ncbi:MAG: hypothetical protein ACLKAO_11995 [Alkaliphilus sp.]